MSGYLYEYRFQDENGRQMGGLNAGGRSRNFSEGRGSFITDFKGFSFDYEPCQRTSAIVCYEIKTSVIFEVLASSGSEMCDPGPGHIGYPTALIKIDLPTNEKINGFVFAKKFLSDEFRNELGEILGIEDDGVILATNCTEESIAEYDQKIAEIADMISSENLDIQTVENMNELYQLVDSLVFK